MIFKELAKKYSESELIEPVYVNNHKICGLRTAQQRVGMLQNLNRFFGTLNLVDITPQKINSYKQCRFLAKVRGRTRSYASVNRELALLRRVLRIAEQEGWLLRCPSFHGLIQESAEVRRERILSREEETRLIEACPAELKAMVVCALDTGLRRGELLSLTWSDWHDGKLTVQALNSKTLKKRSVPVSARLFLELEGIKDFSKRCIFLVKNFKQNWKVAKETAGIEDLHFHDLRHTFATRLAKANLPLTTIGRLLGHSKIETTYRYVGLDEDCTELVRQALEQRHERRSAC